MSGVSQRSAIDRWAIVVCAMLAATMLSHFTVPRAAGADVRPVDVRSANDLYHAGQYRQAVEMLDQLLEPRAAAKLSEPVLISALQLAVDVNRASGRFEAALKYGLQWTQLLNRQAASSGLHLNAQRQTAALAVADLQMSLERPEEAEKTLRQALMLPDGARLSDPEWEADVQVRLARAMAAEGNSQHHPATEPRSLPQKSKQQWNVAETETRQAVERCRHEQLPGQQLVAVVKLQVECLLALDRAGDAAALVDGLLKSGFQEVDEPLRIDLSDELAQCRHAEHNFRAEREALEQALAGQQQADHHQPTVAQAALLNRIALALAAQGDDGAAEEKWKSTASLYRRLLDQFTAQLNEATTKPETQFVDLQCLQGLQEIDLRLGDWPAGVEVSRRLLERLEPRLRSDDPALIRAKTALGAFLAKTDDWNAARPLLEEAAEYWRSHVPAAPAELAGVLVNLAEIARQTGSFAQSQALLEEALSANRKVLAADDMKLAETLSNLAAVQNARGQFQPALVNFREAEAICRTPVNAGDRRAEELLGTTLLNLSMLYKSQRQFEPAATACEQALQLAKKRHPLETDVALLPFHIALASLYLAEDIAPSDEPTALATPENETMVRIDSIDSALRKAKNHINAAHEISVSHPAKNSDATVFHLSALLDFRRGDMDSAYENWSSAMKLAEHNGQTAMVCRCLSYLGQVAVKEGKYDAAEAISRRAVQLQETVQAYPAMHYMALVNRAQVLRKLGRKDEALDCLREAVNVIESPRAETTGADAQRAVYFAQFEAAFDLLVDWSVEEHRWDDALSYAEAGRNRTFLDQVRAAGVDLRASLRGTPQEHLLADEQQILSQYHALQGDAIKRLNAQENSVTVDQENQSNDGDAGELARRLTDLRRRYADIQTAIRDASPFYREMLLGNRGLQAWPVVKPHVLTADSVLVVYYLGQSGGHLFLIDESEKSDVLSGSNSAHDANGTSDSGMPNNSTPNSDTSDRGDGAADNGEVTHYPLVVSDEQSSRLGIPPGPLTRQSAARLVFRYVTSLSEPDQTRTAGRSLGTHAVASSKYALGPSEMVMVTDILMPSAVREQLRRRNPKYITVVPDGALHQMPLEALCVSSDPPRYLLDELPPLAYAPSAMILAALEQRKSTDEHKSTEQRKSAEEHKSAEQSKSTNHGTDFSLLTVGNPRYPEVEPGMSRSANEVALADYLAAGGTLSPLPGTWNECRKVAGALRAAGVSDVAMLEDASASERNVREHLAGRKFVHLAAHGLVDQQYQNLFGALALTPPEDFQTATTENDGFLSLFEIYGLPLKNCELVVLSACQTNVGPDRPLEAGSTMARAFLAAGARRVVCSHWDVDDESTAELIGAFAASIGQSLRARQEPNYAIALADARKYVRNQPKWSSPYHWAPFVLIGPAK